MSGNIYGNAYQIKKKMVKTNNKPLTFYGNDLIISSQYDSTSASKKDFRTSGSHTQQVSPINYKSTPLGNQVRLKNGT